MKLVQGNRGDGVTTQLILESAQFKVPILTMSEANVAFLKSRADELGVNIPEPISFNSKNIGGKLGTQDILVDNGVWMFKYLLEEHTGAYFNIKTFGYTDEVDEQHF